MKNLVIVDFMYLMHRHMYAIKDKEKKNNDKPMMTNPNTGEESARLYFCLRDLETIVQHHQDGNTDIVVCADRKSKRKELLAESTDYKANRDPDRFTELDSAAIKNTLALIGQAGIPVMGIEGYEADDLIHSIVAQHSDKYEHILIYTPDSDLGVLINDKVSLMRYKSVYSKYGKSGNGSHSNFLEAHVHVTKDNYEAYFTEECSKKGSVTIDYNSLMFYKVTVGDISDHIAGIKGFGNAAYEKIRNKLVQRGTVNVYKQLSCEEAVLGMLKALLDNQFINETQYNQAYEALQFVKPYYVDIDYAWIKPLPTLEYRKEVYETTWGIKKI